MCNLVRWCSKGRAYPPQSPCPRTIEMFLGLDHYPITEHLFRSLSAVLHFQWFKMLWELPQALETTFEVERKTRNEEIARGKISFPTYKMHFFFFFLLFGPFLLSKLLSYFLFILNDLKFYRSTTLSSTNHLWTLIATEQHTRNFLGVQGLSEVCYYEFLTPSTLGTHNFLSQF